MKTDAFVKNLEMTIPLCSDDSTTEAMKKVIETVTAQLADVEECRNELQVG